MVTKEEDTVVVAPKDNLQQRLSLVSTVHVSHDREGNQPVVPEKPSEDGYNWRKYGQKNVKGNEYIRSYYKCSYPNCQVKKQVERSHDGRITDITYLGKHDHAKPHSEPQEVAPSLMSVHVQVPNYPTSANEDKSEDKSTVAHAPTTDNAQPMETCEHPAVTIPDRTRPTSTPPSNLARDDCENLNPKKRKKVDGADMAVEKPGHESRVVIHTVSEVDIVNDGYRWRKYGQKMVKGNPNPRSYYRCSTAGCPVKKHVERDSHNPKVVITTYEGQHDHSMPPVRMVVPQSATHSAGGMEPNGISQNKSEESDSAPNGRIQCKRENDEAVDPTTKEERNPANVVMTEPESKPSEQEAEKDAAVDPTTKEESNGANVVKTEPDSNPSEQETQHKVEKGDPTDQTINNQSDAQVEVEIKPEVKASDEKVQDPVSAAPSPDSIDQTAKDEKVTPICNAKLEVVSTDEQKPDPLLESSRQKAEPNERQRLDAEPVNC